MITTSTMTSPFSPNYKPAVDLTDVVRAGKISATRSRQRREGMASDDETVRKAAAGTLPGAPLSKRGRKA